MNRLDYTEAPNLYLAGLSMEEIAKHYGVSRQAVHQMLKKVGIQRRAMYGEHLRRGGTRKDLRVQGALEAAIDRGILQRKTHCEACLSVPREKKNGASGIEAHHCDYNKPLEVMWLCRKCHYHWHKNNRAIPRREGR